MDDWRFLRITKKLDHFALIAWFSATLSLAAGFNLDTDIPVIKFGAEGSYFGYAVAEHFVTEASGERRPVFLVGAPKGDSKQVNTKRAGAFFSCPVNAVQTNSSQWGSRWCEQKPIEYPPPDPENNVLDFYSQDPKSVKDTIESKDNQWLGASVVSSGTNDSKALVCAPYTLFEKNMYQFGICYQLENDLRLTNIATTACSSRLTVSKRHMDFGSCLEGISSTISEKYNVLATGLPGALNWVGGVYALDYRNQFKPFRSTAESRGIDGSVETVLSANSYLGFSVGVGKFGFSVEREEQTATQSPRDNRPRRFLPVTTLVSGAPRFDNDSNAGAVFFFAFGHDNKDLGRLLLLPNAHLKGELMGSSFGYSLAVVDINQDGFDDLIVGAPNYFNASEEEKSSGAVYVYFSRGVKQESQEDQVFHSAVKILGPIGTAANFGASLTGLGDMNKDGFFDFAVGAPYYEKNGAVFIFNGASSSAEFEKSGIKPSQIILASDISVGPNGPALSAFGWSLSGGADLDGNSYPDLLVGAFQSDAVALLRGRPIIAVHASVRDVPSIDKDSQECSRGVAACFRVTTVLALQKSGDQRALLDYTRNSFKCKLETLQYKAASKRAVLNSHNSENPHNSENRFVVEWDCGQNLDHREDTKSLSITIPDDNRDWLNPLQFKFSVKLPYVKPARPSSNAPLENINRYPVLDSRGREKDFKVEFDKKCGPDNKCESELIVDCAFKSLQKIGDTYVKQVGKDDLLNLSFHIENQRERAYESSLFVFYEEEELEKPLLVVSPTGLLANVMKFEKGLIVIDLGNPLEGQNTSIKFDLVFKLARGLTIGIPRPLKFIATANTSSSEANTDNNECSAEVKVIKKAEVRLSGKSVPSRVMYGGKVIGESAMEYEEDIGPFVKHIYVLTNEGPWGVGNVSVFIDFPYEVASPYAHGKWALYLMELPRIRIPVAGATEIKKSCLIDLSVERVNPLNLKADRFTEGIQSYTSRSKRQISEGSTANDRVATVRRRRFVATSTRQQTRELRIQPETVKEQSGETIKRVVVSCKLGTAKCFSIQCPFEYIDAGIAPVIEIRARLWNSTFVEDYPGDIDHVLIVSNAKIVIDPKQGVEQNTSDDFARAETMAQPDIPKIHRPVAIPIYIIIIAIFAGVFLLFLIVIVCWKFGFFERGKHPRQPVYVAEFKSGGLLSDNEDTAT